MKYPNIYEALSGASKAFKSKTRALQAKAKKGISGDEGMRRVASMNKVFQAIPQSSKRKEARMTGNHGELTRKRSMRRFPQ